MVVAPTGLRGVGILQVKLSTPVPVRLVTLKMLVVESICYDFTISMPAAAVRPATLTLVSPFPFF